MMMVTPRTYSQVIYFYPDHVECQIIPHLPDFLRFACLMDDYWKKTSNGARSVKTGQNWMNCVRNVRSARKHINSRFQSCGQNLIGFETNSSSNRNSDRIRKKCIVSKKRICSSNHKLTSKSINSNNPSIKPQHSSTWILLANNQPTQRSLFKHIKRIFLKQIHFSIPMFIFYHSTSPTISYLDCVNPS